MTKLRCLFSLLLLLGAAIGVNAGEDTAVVNNTKPDCDFGAVVFDLDFSGARINQCKKTGRKKYRLVTEPENRPINHSPWYAFRVFAGKGQKIQVFLNYAEHKHRYHPKVSSDGKTWVRLDPKNVKVLSDGERVRLTLDIGPEPLWVSGQEILDNDYYRQWIDRIDALPSMRASVLGESLEGRAIRKIETEQEGRKQYIALIGRQHPPEVTGAMAMKFFIERLLAGDDLAKKFRATYGILMVPNMNPDGVQNGHWRHNSAGMDLNRDWGPFRQPETRLMRDEFARFQKEDGPVLDIFLDFHSTKKDIFYTQPEGRVRHLPEFTRDWLGNIEDRIQQYLPDYEVIIKPGHNPDLSVSKTYINETFGIPAITFEVGDHTNRMFIQALSTVAAEEMMALLLSYQPSLDQG